MRIVKSNNITIYDIKYDLQKWLEKELTAVNPEYLNRKKKGQNTWGLSKYIYAYQYQNGSLMIPWACEDMLKAGLHKFSYDGRLEEDYKEIPEIDFGFSWKLRGYQEDLICFFLQ